MIFISCHVVFDETQFSFKNNSISPSPTFSSTSGSIPLCFPTPTTPTIQTYTITNMSSTDRQNRHCRFRTVTESYSDGHENRHGRYRHWDL